MPCIPGAGPQFPDPTRRSFPASMPLDLSTLEILRKRHPAWRLLRSDHAPLVASFLQRAFLAANVRTIPQADLVERLEDELFALRERLGADSFPRSAREYLEEWASPDKGWLRRFYVRGEDEPRFDITPATEKAIAWLESLGERSFVGTESRLLSIFELVRRLAEGSQADPEKRLADLHRKRQEIDAEIARVQAGDLALLDDTSMRDGFQQFERSARELLSDFREVEDNFRQLDRATRERIALWDQGKGALLDAILGERDAIADSDQGRSFRAFWEFLLSPRRQEELGAQLDRLMELPAIVAADPDPRLRRIHYDWLEAGEHAQHTVAQLSQQLRRFLDDKAWFENRRIMEILHGIEAHALGVRDAIPGGDFMEIDDMGADIVLPMELPLHTPAVKVRLEDLVLVQGDGDIDVAALYGREEVDREELAGRVRRCLQERGQATLAQVVQAFPLERGLAEIVTYLQLGEDRFRAVVVDGAFDDLAWTVPDADGLERVRTARVPRVLFSRGAES